MIFALALLSSLLWGGADFLGGTLARRRPAVVVVVGSQVVGLLTVALVAVLAGAVRDPGGYLPFAVGAGLAGAVGLVAFYAALATGTMGVVSPIAALGVVVPVAVGLARGESPPPLVLVGIVVAVAGVVLVGGPELSTGGGARPLLLAVIAALGFGLALVLIAEGARTSTLMTMVAMRAVSVTALGALVAAPLVVGATTIGRGRGHPGGRDVRRPRPAWTRAELLMLAVIGVADIMANVAFGQATRGGYVSVVSVLGSLYPVVTVLLAMGVHGERLARAQVAGVAVTLTGVALIAGG